MFRFDRSIHPFIPRACENSTVAIAGRGGDDDDDDASAATGMWSISVPDDLLGMIAAQLDDVVDFVRFLGVCRTWRETGASSPAATKPNAFLPWLLAPHHRHDPLLHSRFVFSGTTRDCPWPPSLAAGPAQTMVIGASGRLLAVGASHKACFIDPLAGAVTPLISPLPRRLKLDGLTCTVTPDMSTVVVSSIPSPCSSRRVPIVVAAMLRSRSDDWVDITTHWPELLLSPTARCYAMHLDGNIVCGDTDGSCIAVIPLPDGHGADMAAAAWVRPPPLQTGKVKRRAFLLQASDELLFVRIVTRRVTAASSSKDAASYLSVTVHALEMGGADAGYCGIGWVDKSCEFGDDDRVLFLCDQSSFAMEHIRRRRRGCAYFLLDDKDKHCSVYRYDFADGVATLVEDLPPQWTARSIWYSPQLNLPSRTAR